jgi:hypothetical protein
MRRPEKLESDGGLEIDEKQTAAATHDGSDQGGMGYPDSTRKGKTIV